MSRELRRRGAAPSREREAGEAVDPGAADSPAAVPGAPPLPVAVCTASPSLALLKYWGKRGGRKNLPATPSLAVSLEALKTTTRVRIADRDEVIVDGKLQDPERYAPFFAEARRLLGVEIRFHAESVNTFPAAAGLASSSSGFAALALACATLAASPAGGAPARRRAAAPSPARLSALARLGSASAARALFGGFVLLPAGGRFARQLAPADHWPELRILVAVVAEEAKELSSRVAMERTKMTSPYYRPWVRSAAAELPEAVEALMRRDLERLGGAMRRSYFRMFASMLACDPPILYWAPESLALIRACERLRAEGIGAWETMDAGPQVKVLCLAHELPRVRQRLEALGVRLIESRVGGPAEAHLEVS